MSSIFTVDFQTGRRRLASIGGTWSLAFCSGLLLHLLFHHRPHRAHSASHRIWEGLACLQAFAEHSVGLQQLHNVVIAVIVMYAKRNNSSFCSNDSATIPSR